MILFADIQISEVLKDVVLSVCVSILHFAGFIPNKQTNKHPDLWCSYSQMVLALFVLCGYMAVTEADQIGTPVKQKKI